MKYDSRSQKVCYEKSAEVVVLRDTSCSKMEKKKKDRRLTTKEGLNLN